MEELASDELCQFSLFKLIFLLTLLRPPAALGEPASGRFLLITKTNSGVIIRVDVARGSNRTIPLSGAEDPIAVDLDPVQGRLYWTDGRTNEINSAFLDGSDVRTVRHLGQEAVPDGLAVDAESRLIIYTDAGYDVIGLITMATGYHLLIIDSGLEEPRAVALDTNNGVLYWTDWGSKPRIERANYDGTERRTLISTSLHYPNALALDREENRLYFVDAGQDVVESCDTNGSNRRQILQHSGSHFFGMAVSYDSLYITDWGASGSASAESYLYKASKTGVMVFLGHAPGRMNDIHAVDETTWQRDRNGCTEGYGGCSHICIPSSGNTSKCTCPENLTLAADQKSCMPASGSANTTTKITTAKTTASSWKTSSATREVESNTRTTVKSPPANLPVVQLSVTGPDVFETDGTQELTLHCASLADARTVEMRHWSVTCDRETADSCTFKPQPPEDDGKIVTCTVTLTDGSLASGEFQLLLSYPPRGPPLIVGYETDQTLQAGSDLTMTCTVRGGKPRVTSVIFSCTGHPDRGLDVKGSTEVHSTVSINPLRASDDGAVCVCTAVWKSPELYRLSETIILKVNVTGESGSIEAMSDAAVTGVVLTIVAVFVVAMIAGMVFLKRRGMRLLCGKSVPNDEACEVPVQTVSAETLYDEISDSALYTAQSHETSAYQWTWTWNTSWTQSWLSSQAPCE